MSNGENLNGKNFLNKTLENLKTIITVITGIVVIGIAWGSMNTTVQRHDTDISGLKTETLDLRERAVKTVTNYTNITKQLENMDDKLSKLLERQR